MDTTPQKYHRGDIYYANLEPHLGCEQGGIRPVLVVQNDVGNKHSKTIIVSALTSRTATKAKLPTHVFIDPSQECTPESHLSSCWSRFTHLTNPACWAISARSPNTK